MIIKKLSLGVVVIVLLAALPAQAQLPQTLDDMKAQHVLPGSTPKGAVKNFIDACFVYMNPAHWELNFDRGYIEDNGHPQTVPGHS